MENRNVYSKFLELDVEVCEKTAVFNPEMLLGY